jgi:hypothetical protein
MTIYDQARAIADATGTPCFIVQPAHRPPYIARTPQAVEPGFTMLARVLPHGHQSTWNLQ